MLTDKRKLIKITITILSIVVIFGTGFFLGLNKHMQAEELKAFLGKENSLETQADFAPFWKVWNAIDQKYPDASKITNEDRVFGAISGLVESLDDPYSQFFEPEEAKSFKEEISGNFSGIGTEVGIKDGMLTVIAPLVNTPAYKAGILSGDKILKIDDKITTGLSLDEAIKLIRGEKGTQVVLTVLHLGEKTPIEIKIIRDIINIPTIDTKIEKDKIFVISVYNFSANSANLFRNAIRKFTGAKTNKLIIDLRGNPGGYLSAAIDMASWFLPGGKTVAIEDFGGEKDQKLYRSSGYNIFNDKLRLVILIDEGSASASEILAGALRDHKRAIIVGAQSYGKGSVQEVISVTPTTLFKITVAKWLTPLGKSINDKGLTPDYEIKNVKIDLEAGKDAQMEKAFEILNNWPGIQ